MKLRPALLGLGSVVLLAGCAKTHISMLNTRREELSSQTKIFAVAARNLEETVHRKHATAEQEAAARAVAAFHQATENFARIAGAWRDSDQVNDQYEDLVDAWVEVMWTFPKLEPDNLTLESYQRVEYEWEQLNRSAGYAARKYQKEMEDKYEEERGPKPEIPK